MSNLSLTLSNPAIAELVLNPTGSPLQLTVPTAGGGVANILIDTTEHWNAKPQYVPPKGCIVIYSDRTVIDGVNYAGIKAGDGLAYLIDMPFVGDDVAVRIMDVVNNHITNTNIHVTPEEKNYWNNKLDSELDGENLILSPAIFM